MSDNAKGFTFTWEIENFSMLPYQYCEKLESEAFVVEQWNNMGYYLSLYPKGRKKEGKDLNGEGYISLYLRTTTKDLESKHAFSLTLVSTEPSKDRSLHQENRSLNFGKGRTKLMSLDEIYAHKQLYLPNDTLTIHCNLKPTDKCPEETISRNKSDSVPDFFWSCNSRTGIHVNRRSVTLPVRNIKELGRRSDKVSFILETALTQSAGLKITLHTTKIENEDFVQIEIHQTTLPLGEERVFAKCKMTVLSARNQYQHSKESSHLFQSSLEDTWHFPEFIRVSDLTPDKYLYLDGTLLLQCEFAFSCKSGMYHSEINYSPITFEAKEERSAGESLTNLEELYLGGKFCDVELRAGDRTFPAHKVVLCAMSPKFKAMFENKFENDLKERDSGVVEIKDVDPDTLGRMLACMYSDRLKEELSIESAIKLFSAAEKYDLDTLRRRCSMLLASFLSVTNVCELLVLADARQDNFLLTAVHNFIRSNTNVTFCSEYWKSFMALNPKLSGEIMHQLWMKKL